MEKIPDNKFTRTQALRKAADDAGLGQLHTEIYLLFMLDRFGYDWQEDGYLREWAERIKSGDGWCFMDEQSREVFLKAEKTVRSNYGRYPEQV